MSMKKIKVMIVDDHPMVRKGLAIFVSDNKDMELVGEAGNSAEAIKMYKQVSPDVVLLDMGLPDSDGAVAVGHIRRRYPAAKIIGLTFFPEYQAIEAALQAGARGVLLKTISVEDLANSIRMVFHGKTVFDPIASDVLYGLIAKSESQDGRAALNEREKEILTLLAGGFTNKQIAARLKVQPSTVKQYLSLIFSKLRVQNRAEAVAEALRLNFIKN